MTCTEWLRWYTFFEDFNQAQMRALLMFSSILEQEGNLQEFVEEYDQIAQDVIRQQLH